VHSDVLAPPPENEPALHKPDGCASPEALQCLPAGHNSQDETIAPPDEYDPDSQLPEGLESPVALQCFPGGHFEQFEDPKSS
jgi:hypothetical protein